MFDVTTEVVRKVEVCTCLWALLDRHEKVHDLILMSLSLQRGTMRRRYEDDGISDDEIEGKRTFDLEEKLHTNKYNANFVTFMEGKGQYHFGSGDL